MERPWPLTGRDAEFRAILAALRPGTPGVLVAGVAGVGKTRLVREALAEAARGRRVVWAHGSTAARPFPLGAFAGTTSRPHPARDKASDAVALTLAELTSHGDAVLAVDDAHLLDDLSAIVLHRTVTGRLAPVVVTIRSGEATPDPVTALWKDDHLPRLDLDALDAPTTAALVARVLGGPVEAAAAQRLWALTRGIPLYLRHLLGGEVDAGRFTAASGAWRWTAEPVLTPKLSALLEQQIGTLDPAVQDAVDVVAMAEPVSVPTLAALSSPEAVEAAEARGLVRTEPSPDGLVARLAHPLYGEVRRAGMGLARARRLRGLVAVTLDDSLDPIPRAVLILDSDLPPDPPLFLRAARAATRLYDLPLAERLARAAASGGDPEARLVHASALSWLSRGDEAELILRDLAEATQEASVRALAHVLRTGNLLFTLRRAEDAAVALAAAQEAGGAPVHVGAMTLVLAAARGDVAEVLGHGPEVLDAEYPDELAALLAGSAVAAASAVTARTGLLARAAALGGFSGDRVPTGIPGFGLADWQVLGHRLAGDPRRGVAVARRMQEASANLPPPARLMGLVVVGHAALAVGHLGDALAALQEAWSGLSSSPHEFRFRCRTLLATALAMGGRASEARPLLVALGAEQHPAYRLFAPDDLLARAWGAAAEGVLSEAVGLAVEAAELAREQGSSAYEVLAWQTVVQFGQAAAALPRLAALAGSSARAEAAAAHALALERQDADRLLEASSAWAGLGDLVAAADAAGQAADLLRRQGRQGSALTASGRARELAQRSGARTPAVALGVQPLPLTARELEVASLAAQGLSNRDIARRLTVSVRTVEGHLYRAGHKLGLSDRAAFATVLGGDGSG